MHTLPFSTGALLGFRHGGQQRGLIYLDGVDPADVPAVDRAALLAVHSADEVTRSTRGLADLDYLRAQADRPGPDDEVVVLTMPASTETQDLSSPDVLAFYSHGPRPAGIVLTSMLARLGDLRELAIDLDLEQLIPRVEKTQTFLANTRSPNLAERRRRVAVFSKEIIAALRILEDHP